MVEPTDRFWVFLRRYTTASCSGIPGECSYHNDETLVDEGTYEDPASHQAGTSERSDPRWPTKCARCAYQFTDDDHYQVHYDRQYVSSDGRPFSLHGDCHVRLDDSRNAPPGAMWRATWLEELGMRGPDGLCLTVRTPGGDWTIDYKQPDGSGWGRTGDPPNLSVGPSILIGSRPDGSWLYHGVLTDGVLQAV